MENIDYRVGLVTDPNAQASLTALKQQLTDIYETIQKINTAPVGVRSGGGGIGGGGGSGGGGGGRMGGGGAAHRSAATSAGLPDSGGWSSDEFDEIMYGAAGGSAPDIAADAMAKQKASSEKPERPERKARDGSGNWNSWSKVMAMNSIAYGIEDAYMGGIGGAVNNVPFAAQGIATQMGFDPMDAMAVAGRASLATTAAYMLYRNRESIYDGLGVSEVMSRENAGVFGIASKTESEKAQKIASDANYYASRYGAGSETGQAYMARGADAIVDSQLKASRETSADQMASIRLAGTSAQQADAQRLSALSANPGDFREYYKRTADKDDIREKAEEAWRTDRDYTDPFRRAWYMNQSAELKEKEIKKNEETLLAAQADRKANSLSNALSGNGSSVLALQNELDDPKITAERKTEVEGLLNLSRNLSGSQRFQIDQLRSEASSPYSDVEGNLRQIRSIMRGAGLDQNNEDAVAEGFGAQMSAAQGNSQTNPEENLAQNYGRYARNIGAALGGIEMNTRHTNVRAAQVNNLQMKVYQDLINTGMSPAQAWQSAQSLYASGTNNYRNMVGNAQGNPNGFMNQMDQEQQAAFQMQSQTYNQVLWVRSAMRRNLMMQQSRRGFRGAF